MEVILKSYACRETHRRVQVRVLVEKVSGIGDDEVEVVELERRCTLAPSCPRLQQCPLRAE